MVLWTMVLWAMVLWSSHYCFRGFWEKSPLTSSLSLQVQAGAAACMCSTLAVVVGRLVAQVSSESLLWARQPLCFH